MKNISSRQLTVAAVGVAALGLALSGPARAKVEGDTIILGSAISLTGKYSTNGIHAKNGYDLAVERINAKGGVTVGGKSYKLRVVYYDDESTPARGAQLVERLIKQDDVKYMLGPYSSGLTKAVAPVTEKYKIPMVEAEGAARSLFTQGYRYLFAVLSTSELYLTSSIELAAEVAEKAGRKPSDLKVAMAFENDPFSLDVRAGVVDDAKKFGMNIVIDDKLPRDLSDMSATLTKVRAVKPDILVVSGHSKGAATAARQIKEMQIDVPMIAITHCEAAKVVEKFGESTNGFLCPTQWAETLSYKDAPTRTTRTCPTSPRRRLRRLWCGKTRSSGRTPSTPKSCATRWRPRKWIPSTERSSSPRPATTSPNPWCCARSRTGSSTWWRRPSGRRIPSSTRARPSKGLGLTIRCPRRPAGAAVFGIAGLEVCHAG
jgi:branched-chain amino acid transport system substrate-binding protein